MSSVGDVAFLDDFIAEPDRLALLEWARARHRAGPLEWRTEHRNYATITIRGDGPPEHERLRARVVELLDLPPSAIYEGSFIAFHGPGGEVVSHTDGAPPGKAQLRCNVMLEPGQEGGELLIADERVRMPAGGAWVFFSSDVHHGCTPLGGREHRVFCSFLFRVNLWDLGRDEGLRRASALESLVAGTRSAAELAADLHVDPAELPVWLERVRHLSAIALRPDHERDRRVMGEQLRRVGYELHEAIARLRALEGASYEPARIEPIAQALARIASDVREFPGAIELPAEDEIPAAELVHT